MNTKFIYFVLAFSLTIVIVFLSLSHRSIYKSFQSKSGAYKVEITYYTWRSFIPVTPGSSGDKPGFVEIFANDGRSMGRIPVAMVNSVDFTWLPEGAAVKVQGEWNFRQGTCFYWSDNGAQLFVKGA